MKLMNYRGKNELMSGCIQQENANNALSLFSLNDPSVLLSALTVAVVSHTVNLLSALPLQCLDVLLTVPVGPGSEQCLGVNMDCVHTLVLFMERRLESVKQRAEA